MILPSHPPVDRSDSRRGTSSKASSDGASNEPPTAKSERATSPRSPFGANGLRALQRARSQRPRFGSSRRGPIAALLVTALLVVVGLIVVYGRGALGSGAVRVTHETLGFSLELPKSWAVQRDVARHKWVMPLFARNSDEMQFRLVRTRLPPNALFDAEKPWLKTGERRIAGHDARWIAVVDPFSPRRREIQYALRRGEVTYWLSFSIGRSRFDEYEPLFHQVAQSIRFAVKPQR